MNLHCGLCYCNYKPKLLHDVELIEAKTLKQLVNEEHEQNTSAGTLAIVNSKELNTSIMTIMLQ
jgi:hypothetical protein